MAGDFGGGIYLTGNADIGPNWDMSVDETGDIRTIDGFQELQKDLAYATAVRVGEEVGNRLTPVVLSRIKARAKAAFEDDVRIDVIAIIEVNEVSADTVEVTATVQADEEEVNLVFEVGS